MVFRASISYYIPDYSDVNQAYSLVSKIKAAKDSVEANYPAVKSWARFIPAREITLGVHIESQHQTDLENALKGYLRIAGTPDCVETDSDIALVERVIQEFKQSKERKGFSAPFISLSNQK